MGLAFWRNKKENPGTPPPSNKTEFKKTEEKLLLAKGEEKDKQEQKPQRETALMILGKLFLADKEMDREIIPLFGRLKHTAKIWEKETAAAVLLAKGKADPNVLKAANALYFNTDIRASKEIDREFLVLVLTGVDETFPQKIYDEAKAGDRDSIFSIMYMFHGSSEMGKSKKNVAEKMEKFLSTKKVEVIALRDESEKACGELKAKITKAEEGGEGKSDDTEKLREEYRNKRDILHAAKKAIGKFRWGHA